MNDWNKIGALAQIVGVVVSVTTLFVMLWLAGHAVPVAWWLYVVIGGTVLTSALLHYAAVRSTRTRTPLPLGDTGEWLVPESSPRLLVSHEQTPDGLDWLTIRNDKPRAATNVQSGDLEFTGRHKIMLIPEKISVIQGGGKQRCRMSVYYGNGISALAEILDKASVDIVHSVIIDYDDDSDGKRLCRRFTLSRNLDGTVSWTAGPVMLRGELKPIPSEVRPDAS